MLLVWMESQVGGGSHERSMVPKEAGLRINQSTQLLVSRYHRYQPTEQTPIDHSILLLMILLEW